MKSSQSLTPGSVLHGSYRIDSLLGQGGFGITYRAFDLTLGRPVAIKEFFPKSLCNRDESTSHVTVGASDNVGVVENLKSKFLKEARNIARLNHPNIIRVMAAFEANDTAYYVMELIEGQSLADMVRSEGPLAEARALGYVEQVGHALEYLHARHMNHLDVKPANIMVRREDDCPILIDFGLSKQYDSEGQQTTSTPVGRSHGFAPIEQYSAGGVTAFSPTIDVYSLAATLYFLLSGVVPPPATSLASDPLPFPERIPERLVGPIAKAMSLSRAERYASVGAFLKAIALPPIDEATELEATELDDEATVLDLSEADVRRKIADNKLAAEQEKKVPVNDKKREDDRSAKSGYMKWKGVALVAAAAVLTGGLLVWKHGSDKKDEATVATAQAVDAAQQTASAPIGQESKPANQESASANAQESASANAGQSSPSTKQSTVAEKRYHDATYRVGDVSFDMVGVGGGSFDMGSDDHDYSRPKHRVTLSPYAIGKTEVTQALWQAVMGSNPSKFKGDNRPVEQVSWDDCQTFIRKLNKLTGERFRLPTEAEWEFAARGGNSSKGCKYSGSNSLDAVAWYGDNSGATTHDVATKQPNELGLYDMSGNVSEWCQDLYAPYTAGAVTNPKGATPQTAPSAQSRATRGGDWHGHYGYCRPIFREGGASFGNSNGTGLRLAL